MADMPTHDAINYAPMSGYYSINSIGKINKRTARVSCGNARVGGKEICIYTPVNIQFLGGSRPPTALVELLSCRPTLGV